MNVDDKDENIREQLRDWADHILKTDYDAPMLAKIEISSCSPDGFLVGELKDGESMPTSGICFRAFELFLKFESSTAAEDADRASGLMKEAVRVDPSLGGRIGQGDKVVLEECTPNRDGGMPTVTARLRLRSFE